MSTSDKSMHVLTAALGALVGVALTLWLGPSAPAPASAEPIADVAAAGDVHEPNLCDLDGGRWCTPCGKAGEPACPPAELEGWLCCDPVSKICVVGIADCTASVGWCANYTVDDSGAATCHDE